MTVSKSAVGRLAVIGLWTVAGPVLAAPDCFPTSRPAAVVAHRHAAHRAVGQGRRAPSPQHPILHVAIVRDCLPHDAQIISLAAYTAPPPVAVYGPSTTNLDDEAAIPRFLSPPVIDTGFVGSPAIDGLAMLVTSNTETHRRTGGAHDFGSIDTGGGGWSPGTGGSGPGANLIGPISAVPEPATWSVMLAGMLMVGGLARRRGRTGRPPRDFLHLPLPY